MGYILRNDGKIFAMLLLQIRQGGPKGSAFELSFLIFIFYVVLDLLIYLYF